MGVQALPRTQPVEVVDMIWPQVNAPIDTVTPGAFSAQGFNRLGGAAISVWGQDFGAGTHVMNFYRENIGALLTGRGKGLDGLRCYMQLDNTLLNAAATKFTQPEQCRVWRWSQMIAFTTANPSTQSGIAIMMGNANGAAPTYPSAAGNGAGFGVQGDGAGGLQTFIKPTIAGGFTNVTPIALSGQPLTDVLAFDFEIRGATQAAPGAARIYLNGNLIFTQAWGAGTVLPVYALATAMNHMRAAINGAGADGVFMGQSHVMAGRFSLDNIEFTNPAGGSI